MVTIAPELDGALETIAWLNEAGIVAAIGHTGATYAQARAGYAAGARGTTHLFNGMPELLHREPGPPLAALDSGAYLELIFDGHHVAPELAAWICFHYLQRAVFITDAMAAAGLGDGEYALGGLPVTVEEGVARLHTGSLAGSTITLEDAVANAVASGVGLERAVAMATANPARYLALSGVGGFAPGDKADLISLDEQGRFRGYVL
jgi:N-acetylglucosamine-6-phosphate deacetylase